MDKRVRKPEMYQYILLLEVVQYHNDYFRKQVKTDYRARGSLEKYKRMGDVVTDYLKSKLKLKHIELDKTVSVRKNFPADASGLQVGDFIRFIKKLEVYNNTLQSIFNLLKSKEGKWLYFDAK